MKVTIIRRDSGALTVEDNIDRLDLEHSETSNGKPPRRSMFLDPMVAQYVIVERTDEELGEPETSEPPETPVSAPETEESATPAA